MAERTVEQRWKDAAKEVVNMVANQKHPPDCELCIDAAEEIIAKHASQAEAAPGPSCTVCGEHMRWQCSKCGSTPEPRLAAPPSHAPTAKYEYKIPPCESGSITVSKTAEKGADSQSDTNRRSTSGVSAPDDFFAQRMERARARQRHNAREVEVRASAPPTCPTCGSTIKSVYRRPCDTENQTAHPWHSQPSAEPEKSETKGGHNGN